MRAMIAPVVGRLDPAFLQVMEESKELLKYALQTENYLTLPVSDTGSAGMEAAMYNVVAPGEAMAAARELYG